MYYTVEPPNFDHYSLISKYFSQNFFCLLKLKLFWTILYNFVIRGSVSRGKSVGAIPWGNSVIFTELPRYRDKCYINELLRVKCFRKWPFREKCYRRGYLVKISIFYTNIMPFQENGIIFVFKGYSVNFKNTALCREKGVIPFTE